MTDHCIAVERFVKFSAHRRNKFKFRLVQPLRSSTLCDMPKFDLRLEDCIKGMSRLDPGSVDLVVTSPPYNLGIKYNQYSDKQDRLGYLRWCADWASALRRILSPTGSLFLNIGSAPSNP